MALAFVSALYSPLSAQDRAPQEIGKAFAEQNCAACHSVGLSGESMHKDAPPFRVIAVKYPLDHLEEALAEGIVTGHSDMPAFEMEPPQIAALIEYLDTLRRAAQKSEGAPRTR